MATATVKKPAKKRAPRKKADKKEEPIIQEETLQPETPAEEPVKEKKDKPKKDEAKESIEALVKALNSKTKSECTALIVGNSIGDILDSKTVTSGLYNLDIATEIGGIPYLGVQTEIFGAEGTGKSTIAAKVASSIQKLDKSYYIAWLDIERTYDKHYFESLGLDGNRVILIPVTEGDYGIDAFCNVMMNKYVKFGVVDSVGAAVKKEQLQRKLEKGYKIGTQSKLITEAVNKVRNIINADNINNRKGVLWINQIRDNLDMYSSQIVRPGGRAFEHNISLRIGLQRDYTKPGNVYLKTDDDTIIYIAGDKKITINNKAEDDTIQDYQMYGHTVMGLIDKSKLSTASVKRTRFKFKIVADEGLSRKYDLFIAGRRLGIIDFNGKNHYTIDGTTYNSNNNAIANILKHEDYLVKQIETRLKKG